MVKNIDELHLVSTKTGSEMFIVAKFILWAYENAQSLFSSLIDLTKGFLTYRAIYQIDEGEKHDHLSKLRNVKCFLDCSLLVSLLGYDTPESQASVQSLTRMLRNNGAQIYIFEHTIEEAKYLLMSYADSPDKLRFRLPGIKAKHLSDAVIRTQALRLDVAVEKLGITKHSIPDEIIEKERANDASLLNFIRDSQGNGHRSEYDFKSVVGIKSLRKNGHPLLIEKCSAFLVTQDLRLAYSIRKQTLTTHHEVALAKLDADIIALLWLQSFTACPDIPKEVLLSNAAAAVTLSDDVRKRAIELTEMWTTDGSMDPSMAATLRSDRLDEMLLANYTSNDPSVLSLEAFKSVMKEMLSCEIEAEKEDVRQQERAEYLRRAQAERAEFERNLAEKEASDQRQKRDADRKRLIARSRRVDSKASKCAKRCRNVAKWASITMLVIVVISLSILQVIDILNTNNAHDSTSSPLPWWIWAYRGFTIILSIYGIISFFIDRKLTFFRCLNAFQRKVYMTSYAHYEKIANEWGETSEHDSISV